MELRTYDGLAEDAKVSRATRCYSMRIDATKDAVLRKAVHLVEHFISERARLHAKALEEATVGPDGKLSVSKWCSTLKLTVYLKKGDLVIEWDRRLFDWLGRLEAKATPYLRRSQSGDYSLKFLRDRAEPYEVDLVAWAETEAAILRARWRALDTLSEGVRELEKSVRKSDQLSTPCVAS